MKHDLKPRPRIELDACNECGASPTAEANNTALMVGIVVVASGLAYLAGGVHI